MFFCVFIKKSAARFIGLPALAGVALLFGGTFAVGQPSNVLAEKADGLASASALVATAQQKGHVRVIVSLKAPPLNAMGPKNAAAIAADVAGVTGPVISRHFGSAAAPSAGRGFARALVSFPVTAGFAVNVSAAELEALAADPSVLAIHEDGLAAPQLLDTIPLVGMAASYASGATGSGRTVAVVDTGVKSSHIFLAGKVVMEACFSNAGGGGNGLSLCPNGGTSQFGTGAADPNSANCTLAGATSNSFNLCSHGTHVASIAAGFNTSQVSGRPTNGVAKSSKIFAIQVFTRHEDSGSCGGAPPCARTYWSDMISALNYIAQNPNPGGVPVAAVNMSIGGSSFVSSCDTHPLKPAIDLLRFLGIVSVISSGNDGSTAAMSGPGCVSSALGVGSTSKADVISSFSNMSDQVALLAPGGEIGGACTFTSGDPRVVAGVAVNGGAANLWGCMTGTSMAAPHVAGAVASIKSACPTATPAQIQSALVASGLPILDTRAGGTIKRGRLRVDRAVSLACGPKTRVPHDYNGDRTSDVLWRDTTNGNAIVSRIEGGSITGSKFIVNLPLTWSIVGGGDFTGDGRSDILWQDQSGNVVVTALDASGGAASSTLLATLPAPWAIVGTGDFNGDGAMDILWRNTTTGDMVISYSLAGVSLFSQYLLTLPPPWTVAGVADFNGDGAADILWRNSVTGATVVSVMDPVAMTIASSTLVATLPSPWTVAGVGDFNGDGRSDILWRNSTTGATVVSLMASGGASIASSTHLATLPSPWGVAMVGDFNGDGRSDILWRDSTSGAAVVSTTAAGGAAISGSSLLASPPATFQVMSTNQN